MQKWLILIGILFICIGVLFPLIMKLGLGRLPGDILIKKGNLTFYFPLMTSIVISIIISVIAWFIK